MSTSGRQQPVAGLRARLLNRGAYQWYLGTIIGLAYQSAEIAYVWTSHGAVGEKILATAALAVYYLAFITLPPLIWPQSTRTRIVALSIYWAVSFALLPLLGTFVIWLWPLVISMIAFSWLPFLPSLIMIVIVGLVQLALAAADRFDDGTGFAPIVTVIVAVSLFSITRQIVANQRLRSAQATIATLAAAEERARLARDLHDVLGHSLTVVAVKSELAGRLVERDPAKAIAEIADIEGLARTALADLRAAVSSYRDITLDSELAAARTALDAAGIRAHLPVDAGAVDADLRALFGWVLREGVTNVIRHSKASACWVELSASSLTVRDDGSGAAAGGAGNGLAGLRERALEAGATLTAGAGDAGGFALTVERVTP